MSVFFLKEIGISDNADEAALELFASCQEQVVSVSATPLMPDYIAVTVRNGFIELIHTVSGNFRLFLTHLDHIPLDASLRCFSLVPNFYPTALDGPRYYLLFSLAYSNELLLANVDTGRTLTLATCSTRPSTVHCDGDYIACGEGDGCVTVWQTSGEDSPEYWAERGRPPVVWKSTLLNDTVSCLHIYRDTLFCCSVNFHCILVSIEHGHVLSRLSVDFEPVVGAFPLTYPRLPRLVLAVCLRSRISIFGRDVVGGTTMEDDRSRAGAAVPSGEVVPHQRSQWLHTGGAALDADVECASCLGPYLATGTSSGVVVLYHCDAALTLVGEVIRFDVGYSVKGIQLFDDDSLVVVTSVGDVWRWPLQDLLQTAEEGKGAGSDDVAVDPLPSAAPTPQPALVMGNEAPLDVPPNDFSYTQEGEVEDRCLSHHEVVVVAYPPTEDSHTVSSVVTEDRTLFSTSLPLDGHPVTEIEVLSSEDEAPVSPMTERDVESVAPMDQDDGGQYPEESEASGPDQPPCHTEDSAMGEAPATMLFVAAVASLQPGGFSSVKEVLESKGKERSSARGESESQWAHLRASPVECLRDGDDTSSEMRSLTTSPASTPVRSAPEGCGMSPPGSAPMSVCSAKSRSSKVLTGEENGTDKDEREATADAGETERGTPCRHRTQGRSEESTKESTAMDALEVEFTTTMKRMLGASLPVEGLRSGRRMDPRKVVGILQNKRNQQRGNSSTTPEKPLLVEHNSTELLKEQQCALREVAFDFDAYRDSHRLEVDALLYRHPIHSPTYTLEDRVFDEVPPRIENGTTAHLLLEGQEESDVGPG